MNGIQRVGVVPAVDELSTVELATNPAESGKLAASHNLVEIAEACRREADAYLAVSGQPVESDSRWL